SAAATATWGAIRAAISAVWSWAETQAGAVWTAVRNSVEGAWNAVAETATTVWQSVRAAIEAVDVGRDDRGECLECRGRRRNERLGQPRRGGHQHLVGHTRCNRERLGRPGELGQGSVGWRPQDCR